MPLSNSDRGRYDGIRIVLVNTSHPGNIGAAARAMKNMGLARLYLVAPLQFPAERAVWRAAGAVDVLERAVVVATLDEAIADCGLVVATSARERSIPWPQLDPRQCGARLWAESARHEVALVFGREDRGLTNDELQKSQYHVQIPASASYSSLNLAAAVQVLTYEIRMQALAAESAAAATAASCGDVPLARMADLERYFVHLEQTLVDLDFHDRDNPRQTMARLRRLFNRIRLDRMELSILRGVLTAMQHTARRLKDQTRVPGR